MSLAVVAQPDPFVVQLTVEIDIFTAEQLAALATHPDNAHGTVVFDLAGLTFLGSAGLTAFLAVAGAAHQFRCRNASPPRHGSSESSGSRNGEKS